VEEAMPVQHESLVQQQIPVEQMAPVQREEPVPATVLYRPVEHRTPAQPTYEQPAYPPSRKGPAIFAAIAAVLAAAIAVVALVVVLAQRDDPGNGTDPNVPTLGGGPPPTGVQVRDYGTSVEITWTNPGEGKNSTIITGGHPGEVLKPMGEVGPGETRFELRGLNDQLDYCFAVVAVYGTDSFASSAQSCTTRPAPKKSYR
jgi:hypothetical protein